MTVSRPCVTVRQRRVPSTVREAMLTSPKTCGVTTTVMQARAMFRDDHVHSLLVVRRNRLVAMVSRRDLEGAPAHLPVAPFGDLAGRVVGPDVALEAVFHAMIANAVRRLAVVDGNGDLLGLLCLKQSHRGFCSDDDVRARASCRTELTA